MALVAVVTLALGIGATTAVFSVVSALLLRPLPYAGGDAVVVVTESRESEPDDAGSTSYANAVDWNALSRTLEAVAVVDDWAPTVTGRGRPERLHGATVTAEIFDVLRVRPALGRALLASDGHAGAEPVVVVSDGFWRRRLAADPDAIGRPLVLDDVPRIVAGVLPRGFRAPLELGGEVWGNHVPVPGDTRDSRSLRALGRLRPGSTLEAVRAEMATISSRLERAYPAENAGMKAVVTPLRDELAGDARHPLLLLLAAAAGVLLVACANLSNLLLARSLDRRREFAIRTALGVTRRGLVRQVLVESALLAGAGGAAGVVLALWATDVLPALAPPVIRATDVPLDVRVLAFAAALSGMTVLLVGVLPAARSSRVDVVAGLRTGGRSILGGSNRTRRWLATAQVSVAVALVTASGLLLKSFERVQRVDPGIRAEGVLAAALDLPSTRYPEARIAPFFEELLDRVVQLPTVDAAGAVSTLPLSGDWDRVGLEVDGRPPARRSDELEADRYIVTPGYFAAIGVPLRSGRLFDSSDRAGGEPVALIDEVFARRVADGASPIGFRLRFPWSADPMRVVGVVGHVRHYGVDRSSAGQVYLPLAQVPWPWMSVVVRTAGDPLALVPELRRAVESVDPDQPIDDVATMEQRLRRLVSTRRFTTAVMGGFAAVATGLAALGLYGVVAHAVGRRRTEVGLRMALGATARAVLVSVLGEGLGLAARGLVFGMAAAWAGSRLLRGLLFGVAATDGIVMSAAAAVLLGVSLLATGLPALRAARVAPAETLRND